MNFFKTLIIIGLAFNVNNFHVDARASKKDHKRILSDSKSSKGSTFTYNEKDAGAASSTLQEPKSGKSNDISPGMSMIGKSGKSDAAYDMSMAKSGKSEAAYDMSMGDMGDGASLRGGKAGKSTKQAKAHMSMGN